MDKTEGSGVAVDSWDNIYVTGETKGDMDGNTSSGGMISSSFLGE